MTAERDDITTPPGDGAGDRASEFMDQLSSIRPEEGAGSAADAPSSEVGFVAESHQESEHVVAPPPVSGSTEGPPDAELAYIEWLSEKAVKRGESLVLQVHHDQISAGFVSVIRGRYEIEWASSRDIDGSQGLPSAMDLRSAVAEILDEVPGRASRTSVILAGRLVRESIHEIPRVPRKHVATVLKKKSELAVGQTLGYTRLGEVDFGGHKSVAYATYVAEPAVVMPVLQELRDRGHPARDVLPRHVMPVLMAHAASQAVAARELTLWVDIAGRQLNLSFIRGKDVVFHRHSTLPGDHGRAARIIGEIQRTSVYFHRKFRGHETAEIRVAATRGDGLGELASELESLMGIPTSLASYPVRLSEDVYDDRCLAFCAMATARSWSELTTASLVPRAWQQHKERRIAVPAVIVMLAVGLGMVGFAHMAVAALVDEKRRIAASREAEGGAAEALVQRWRDIEGAIATVGNRFEQLDRIVGGCPEISGTLLYIARNTPPGVSVVDIELTHPDEINEVVREGRPGAAPRSGWRSTISCRTDAGYFESATVVDLMKRSIMALPGVDPDSLTSEVSQESLPYTDERDNDGEIAPRGTAFSITFRVVAS